MKVAFIGNQGGRHLLSFYAGMARALSAEFGIASCFSVSLDSELGIPLELRARDAQIYSFESYVQSTPAADAGAIDLLLRQYRELNWSEIVAAERAFTDYSMLLGAAGDRSESNDYVQRLVVSLVRYFELVVADCDAVVCQTADTLLSLIAVKVAQHHAIPVSAIRPVTLIEPGTAGGFFGNSEFLDWHRMIKGFSARRGVPLSTPEVMRVGDRQQRREHGSNVLFAAYDRVEISQRIHEQICYGRYASDHIFGDGDGDGDGNASKLIADKIAELNYQHAVFTL